MCVIVRKEKFSRRAFNKIGEGFLSISIVSRSGSTRIPDDPALEKIFRFQANFPETKATKGRNWHESVLIFHH